MKERKSEYDEGRDMKEEVHHHENNAAAVDSIECMSLSNHSNGRGEIPNSTSGICSQVETLEEGEWEYGKWRDIIERIKDNQKRVEALGELFGWESLSDDSNGEGGEIPFMSSLVCSNDKERGQAAAVKQREWEYSNGAEQTG